MSYKLIVWFRFFESMLQHLFLVGGESAYRVGFPLSLAAKLTIFFDTWYDAVITDT